MAKELDLGDYDTDKRLQPHYLENFEEYLGHLAEQPITLLELGLPWWFFADVAGLF
jgi:hypothetical protein